MTGPVTEGAVARSSAVANAGEFDVFTRTTSIVFILFVGTTDVAAQRPISMPAPPGSPQSLDDIRDDYRVHAGPFYVEPTILLKELGLDTNVFNQAGETAADLTLVLAPQAAVAIPFATRALVKSLLATDLVYYAQYGSERSVDPQMAVRAEFYGQRVTLYLEEAYLNTRERLNYEIDLRARHLQNELTGGVAYRATTRLTVEIAARQGRIRFDGDDYFGGQRLKETLDRDTRIFTATARHRRNGLTTFGLRYEIQADRFPLSPVRDTNSFRVMPGVELRPRALFNGSAWVGYRHFEPKAAVLPPRAGLVSQLSLSYALLGATVFGVTYDRDYQFAYEARTPYFVDNSLGLFVRRALGGRADVRVNVARHRYDFQPLLTEPILTGPAVDRVDTTDNFGVNVGFRVKRQTRAGVGLSYWTRDSTGLDFRNYKGLRIGLTMDHDF
jgi:hypothetical protein